MTLFDWLLFVVAALCAVPFLRRLSEAWHDVHRRKL